MDMVLNLIITGIPSIQYEKIIISIRSLCFKPYYNWNTFNTGQLYDAFNKYWYEF